MDSFVIRYPYWKNDLKKFLRSLVNAKEVPKIVNLKKFLRSFANS